jgi:phenylalanyl-tRNA synthetase beta chain
MRIPLSWLKEFVEIDVPAEVLAERLSLAGLEVEAIEYIGVPQTQAVPGLPTSDHLVWDRQRLLLGKITEVKAHPNADKLVLALVEIGGGVIEQCVTGAPNLFAYKDQGPLASPLWTAFAAEGAEVWDGHSEERKRMILKEKPLRGIPNKSMVCSDKELGISEEHDGIILMHQQPNALDGTAHPAGTPLQDVLGDVVFEIALTPNLARCYSVLGVAREVAALLGKEVKPPSYAVKMDGAPIAGAVRIDIQTPELNPRFTLSLLRDVTIKPSPEWMQRRLRLMQQRPINNIVDVTNYITFEIGQPLHAFDYDKLTARVNGAAPTIITRLPKAGETLETLDQVKRDLQPHNILVCDDAGVLSMGGIIGGADTEISDSTKTVLLEAANWNYINIRRTMQTQAVRTDAGTRFSRGVHPSQALLGVQRGAELMRVTSGGTVAQGILDEYPLPPKQAQVTLSLKDAERLLGISVSLERAVDILSRLGFAVTVGTDTLQATAPDFRTDIGEGVVGQADLVEEIGRILGYDHLPNTIMSDEMPTQWANVAHLGEERVRDLLAGLGLRENISYRLTTVQAEARLVPAGALSSLPDVPYVTLANPISPDKTVMRHTLLGGLLEAAQENARWSRRQQVFEIGAVFLPRDGQALPDEPRHLAIVLTGPRSEGSWAGESADLCDFFDLKGVLEGLLGGLHVAEVSYQRADHTSLHPGRSAQVRAGQRVLGVIGELHPQVADGYKLSAAPVLVAELDLDAVLAAARENHSVQALPVTPPILQDLALVVKQDTTAAAIEAVIRKAGGALLRDVRLFDVYVGDPIPAGFKNVAYSLTYQTNDRTLTDKEVTSVQTRIIKAAERELGAQFRS